MKILAADTSTPVNTIAVCDGDRIIAETVVDCGRAHAERLMGTVDWVLRESGISLDQIELLAISAGPGSFTGLRIGVAAWKGLAFARGLPLIGVPTLDALTRLGAFYDVTVCPLLDAKMKEVFAAVYRFDGESRTKILDDRVLPIADLLAEAPDDTVFFGDGAELYREAILQARPGARVLGAAFRAPRASAVAAEAYAMAGGHCACSAADVAPVYLRMSQPEMARVKATS